MSGQYLKQVHACNLPEFDPGQGQGTVWQCECDRIFIQTWRDSAYGLAGNYAWRVIHPECWDAENLIEKPYLIDLSNRIKHPQSETPLQKKWWKR